MISEIAYQLIASLVRKVQFIDKWAGLVVPMRKVVDKVEKIFPAAVRTPSGCDASTYLDLMPDDSKESVIYVEKVNDPTMEEMGRNFWLCNADLRIIVWYNLNRITEGNYIDEGIVAANILSQLPKRLPDSVFTYVKSVLINPIRVVSGPELFSRYTYDEKRTQFMSFPYGAIGIDVNVQYMINKCAETLIPEPDCGFGGLPLPEYTNTITIVKVVEGDANNEDYFEVTITGSQWEYSGEVRVGEPLIFSELLPDVYTITETALPGYTQKSISHQTVTIPTTITEVTITNTIDI